MKSFDTVALGTCYVDTNLSDYPFANTGIPAETELVGERYEMVAGGSAVNFCRLLGEFGLRSAFIGMAGSDPNGTILESLLQQDGVDSLLIRRPDLLTNISFNMTSPTGEHIMLVAGTANAALSPEAVLPQLDTALNDAKTLYLGGCFKLKTLAPAFLQIIEAAHRNNVTTIIDHGRVPEATTSEMLDAVRQLAVSADYYLPSRDEFCKLWEVETIKDGLEVLHHQAPDLKVIVKDGANGAYFWENDSPRRIPALHVDKIVHATGAGDSFNAGVITAITHGRPLVDAVIHGCVVAAAQVVGKRE